MKSVKKNNQEQYVLHFLIGTTVAFGVSLCALEFGRLHYGQVALVGMEDLSDRWLEEDLSPPVFEVAKPPVQRPAQPKVEQTPVLTNQLDIIADDKPLADALPEFDFTDDSDWFIPEAVVLPDIQPRDFADRMPRFPGGDAALFLFLGASLKYPDFARVNGISGKVYVKFVVNAKGKIDVETIEILDSPHPVLSKEAIRVIKMMPDWEPGMQGPQKVAVNMKLPFQFLIKP